MDLTRRSNFRPGRGKKVPLIRGRPPEEKEAKKEGDACAKGGDKSLETQGVEKRK